MVLMCAVRGCKNESYPGCGKSFHRFPTDEVVRNKWIAVLQTNKKISKQSAVCSQHFVKEDFLTVAKKRLKPEAVPSIFSMELQDVAKETITSNEQLLPKEESSYVEMEIPYNLFQFVGTESCNVQSLCRICLSTNNDVLYRLDSTKDNIYLTDIFTALTTVQLIPEDGMPSSICELCYTKLLQCYDFKLKCERSDYMLRSVLKGDFITKEEPFYNNKSPVKEEVDNTNTSEVKEEVEPDEEIEYLEDFTDDDNESNINLCIIQELDRRKRKISKDNVGSNNLKKIKTKSRNESDPFTCIHCYKEFAHAKTLRMHIKQNHSKSAVKRQHNCDQCKESFEFEHDLNVHSALHTKGNTWKCNKCQKEYHTKTSFRRHLQRHMQHKAHVCACGRSFTELYALRRHARVHTGQQREKRHQCTVCGNRYSSGAQLAAHAARHSGARPCACACGKRFASARLLASHALVHSDLKPHACAYCDKRFRHESTRNIHHRTHTGEKPYVCAACGKSFIQNSNLTLHMRTHTGERPYSCKICSRTFSSGSSLKSHARVHSGERPYSCSVCGKRFARRNLAAHMRQHTGERPFACSACPKKFVNASRLRDHCRIHTGEKPYECAYCTSTFATKSHLVKHFKTHDPPRKKQSKCDLVTTQKMPSNPPIMANNITNNKHTEQLTVADDAAIVAKANNMDNGVTLNIIQKVPLNVAGEHDILQDNGNILIVENNETNHMTLDAENMNIIDGEVTYDNDMNLVTVNEEGVSISGSSLEGTTVKLYQLDQSLVQIHSSGGQVTISKITSKMTANF